MNETRNPVQKTDGVRNYKRRIQNIMIHKPLQREFLFVIIALLIVSTLAIGFVIHATIREAAFGGGFRFGKISPYEILSDVSYDLVIRVSLILMLTLIVIGVFGVSFLHRVAGPVHRFRHVLMRLNKRELPGPIKLREGDFFNETADEINRLIIAFRENREKLLAIQTKIEQAKIVKPDSQLSRRLDEMQKLIESALLP